MKTIYMTLAAVSALAVAAPLAAQPWNGDKSPAQSWNGGEWSVAQLQRQIDTGVEHGSITRREAMPLRDSLRQLTRMERQFSGNGFSSRERSSLQQRSASLHRQIVMAEGNRSRTAGMERHDAPGYAANDRHDMRGGNDMRSASRDMRGDRFAGDVRIGQPYSARQVALPSQYRERYKDDQTSYYRYDEDRIYQIDRVTGLIVAMFNTAS